MIAKIARLIVIGLVIVSLCGAGANAARRTYTESQKKTQAPVKLAEVGPNAPPETPGGNMAPGSCPTTEQQCILQAVTAPGGNDRSEERLSGDSPLHTEAATLSGPRPTRSPLGSLAEAAPQTARILTLVGAVPSGTM